jgi:excisionase family DNA binding protein
MDEIALSINGTAKALGVGRSTIYKLIKSGQIETLKSALARLSRQRRS